MKITLEKYNALKACGNADIVGQVDHEGMTYDIVTNYLDQRTDHIVHVPRLAWLYTPTDEYLANVSRLEKQAGIV